MLNKTILLIVGIFLLIACSDNHELEIPAKEQFKKCNKKKLENCKKEEPKHVKTNTQKKKATKKNIRGLTIESDDIVYGNLQAKIVFIEYFSPTCRHCVFYHQRTFPQIRERYIDTGKIAYVIREFIGNRQDLDATILARCSGNTEDYTKFINIILDQQNNWLFNKSFHKILTNIGTLGGVSAEQYTMCLKNDDLLNTLIGNTKVVVKEPFFKGTPSFFINGKQFTKPYTFEELSNTIDKVMINDKSKKT